MEVVEDRRLPVVWSARKVLGLLGDGFRLAVRSTPGSEFRRSILYRPAGDPAGRFGAELVTARFRTVEKLIPRLDIVASFNGDTRVYKLPNRPS